MEVTGNNVLLENPFYGRADNGIHLTDDVKEQMIMNELAKCKELSVFKAGYGCVKVKDGNKVYVDIDRLMNLPRVTLKTEDKEKDYFIARETDIIIIY